MLFLLIQSIPDPVIRNRLMSLYQNRYDWLIKKAQGYVQDPAVSEDIIQDVFLRLIQKSDKWTTLNDDQLLAYVVQMTKNKAVDYLRFNKKEFADLEEVEAVVSEDFVDKIMDRIETEEIYQILGKALLSLSSKEQTIILQKFIFEESNEQIAERVNMKPNSIPVTVTRIKKKLTQYIKIAKSNEQSE